MTETIKLPIPDLKDVVGVGIYDYPEGFTLPFQHWVRSAFVNHREAFESGAEFTVPGYGVLTTAGRAYTFDTTAQYRKAKDYPETISGSWG